MLLFGFTNFFCFGLSLGLFFRGSDEDNFIRINQGLTEIPADIPEDTTSVVLSGNNISRIPANSFRDLKDCEYLDLFNNSISRIEPHAFAGLKNLKVLDLSTNQLALFQEGAFFGLISVKSISLGNNCFVTLNSSVLDGLTRPLELDLRGNKLKCDRGLCWLREQERRGDVTWILFGHPSCTYCCPSNTWWRMDEYCSAKDGAIYTGLPGDVMVTPGIHRRWLSEEEESADKDGPLTNVMIGVFVGLGLTIALVYVVCFINKQRKFLANNRDIMEEPAATQTSDQVFTVRQQFNPEGTNGVTEQHPGRLDPSLPPEPEHPGNPGQGGPFTLVNETAYPANPPTHAGDEPPPSYSSLDFTDA